MYLNAKYTDDNAFMNARKITEYLKNRANADIAAHSQKFFKTGRGEYGFGDRFLGIRVPVLRQAVKKFKTASADTAQELLHSEYHEIRLFALLLLVYRFSRAQHAEREKIYNIYLHNTAYINNWDLVDSSAHHIVGAYLEDKDRAVLYELAKSESLWERRIAVMATFYYIKKNSFQDTLKLSELLLNDREDLIHKAVGWMLREVGNRDKAAEIKFLKARYHNMPRTMLRYAIEKFPKEERRQYLNGEI